MNWKALRKHQFFLEAQLVASQQALKQLECQKAADLINISVDSHLLLSLAICEQISLHLLRNLATLAELNRLDKTTPQPLATAGCLSTSWSAHPRSCKGSLPLFSDSYDPATAK